MSPLIIIPAVHSNGTSREDLVAQAWGVSQAAKALVEALRAAMPNGRDYYPLGGDAAEDARDAWMARIVAADNIRSDFSSLARAIKEA